MNCMMNSKSSLVVDHSLRSTTLDDVAIRTDEQEVRDGHKSERNSERVDPEVVLLDGIAEGEMTSNTFIVAEHAKDSEGLCEPFFASLALIFE